MCLINDCIKKTNYIPWSKNTMCDFKIKVKKKNYAWVDIEIDKMLATIPKSSTNQCLKFDEYLYFDGYIHTIKM